MIASFLRINFHTLVCKTAVTGGKDTCQGDSGGPLYFFKGNKHSISLPSSKSSGTVTLRLIACDPFLPILENEKSAEGRLMIKINQLIYGSFSSAMGN
jgi:hypothetical protein